MGVIVVVNDCGGRHVVDNRRDVDVVENVLFSVGVVGIYTIDECLQVAVVFILSRSFVDAGRGRGN